MNLTKCIVGCVLILVIWLGCGEKYDVVGTAAPQPAPRATLRVPSVYPTIQVAVDSAGEFDTVLVADGIYTGDGNRDIDLSGRSLYLISENGPEHTLIDIDGSETDHHTGFICQTQTSRNLVIDGFTVTGGWSSGGGAVQLRSSSPIIRNCVFIDNVGDPSGGAVRCKTSAPAFKNCTFVGNRATTGGTLFCLAGSQPTFSNCIIAFGGGGGSVVCSGSEDIPLFTCSNIFGNAGGDWIEQIDSLATENNNLEVDPLFCSETGNDFRIESQSPCSPGGNACGELMGALAPVDCSKISAGD